MATTDPGRAGLRLGTPVRSRRAMLKASIADGTLDAAALIAGDVDEDLERVALGIRIGELLRAVPGVGPSRELAILDGRAGGLRRLGELTTRQRRAIADTLRKETQ